MKNKKIVAVLLTAIVGIALTRCTLAPNTRGKSAQEVAAPILLEHMKEK